MSKTKSRQITIRMTAAEAHALIEAAGATIDHDDEMLAVMPNAHTRKAAYRGYDKLCAAAFKHQTPRIRRMIARVRERQI